MLASVPSCSADEKNMLLLVAEGDVSAFRQLFEAYKNKVYSYAVHYTDSTAEAEEIVQEVFIKVWLHKETLPFLERFEAWLFTITRNLSFNSLRRVAREASFVSLAGETAETGEQADQPLLYKEQEKLLRIAVDQLPPQQQLVYKMHNEQHLSALEIARQLNISHSTVKNHLSLATRAIRSFLKIVAIVTPLAVWYR
jgi:RNA polymerase sigma-70 factor (family 1)